VRRSNSRAQAVGIGAQLQHDAPSIWKSRDDEIGKDRAAVTLD